MKIRSDSISKNVRLTLCYSFQLINRLFSSVHCQLLSVTLTSIIVYNYNEFVELIQVQLTLKNNRDFSGGQEGEVKRRNIFISLGHR